MFWDLSNKIGMFFFLFFQVVIAAEPKKERGTKAFSIYGNPEINYSKLYDLPVNVPDTLPEG